MALDGNPYDGHTLSDTLEQVDKWNESSGNQSMSLLTWGIVATVIKEIPPSM
jgi:hypothetical protein